MKSKKILLTLLAACSCLPSVSALENKKGNSKPKTESKSNPNQSNSTNTMNPIASGGIGFITGAGTVGLLSGLGVRHIKNKEIEAQNNRVTSLTTEKTTLQQEKTTLQQEKTALQQENDTLKQENEEFKSKLTGLKNKYHINDKPDSELIDELFKVYDLYTKVSNLYLTFIGSLNQNAAGPSAYLNMAYPFGWTDEDPQITFLDVMVHPEALKIVKPGNDDIYAYVSRCQTGLLEAIFDPEAHPSTFVDENYKLDKAKDNEAEIALKPNLFVK